MSQQPTEEDVRDLAAIANEALNRCVRYREQCDMIKDLASLIAHRRTDELSRANARAIIRAVDTVLELSTNRSSFELQSIDELDKEVEVKYFSNGAGGGFYQWRVCGKVVGPWSHGGNSPQAALESARRALT